MGDEPRSPGTAARRWSLRLRPTLITLVLGLLFLTVGSIGGIALTRAVAIIDNVVGQQFEVAAKAAAAEVEALVHDVPDLLHEYAALARLGILPIADKDTLGILFVERLRQFERLAWIGYGDAVDATFTGATRRGGGGLRLVKADPGVSGGLPTEISIGPGGSRTRADPFVPEPYIVTEKPWFRTALGFDGVGWLDPYQFTDGVPGVTAALPLILPGDDAPVGVFHADLHVDSIVAYLDEIRIGKSGRVHLLTRRGDPVALAADWAGGDPALAAAAASIGFDPGAWPGDGDGRAVFRHADEDYRLLVHPIQVPDGPDWIVVALAPESDFTGYARRSAQIVLVLSAVALALAVTAAMVLSSRISVPLRRIAEDLEQVGAFDLGQSPSPPTFVREVAIVGEAAERMKASLRSFGRYVPRELVRDLLASGREAELGGQRRRVSIHFSDIAGFTSVAERLPPERMVEELSGYFELMRDVLREDGGVIDKFMGDGILAFFNAPMELPGHEIALCRSALAAQARLAEDRRRREAEGRPPFDARIGLEVGDVFVGNIGTADRFAYTAIGDPVNLAARLEGLGKFYGARILGSADLKAATGDAFEWRRLDRAAVVGRRQGTEVYELLAEAGGLSAAAADARDAYETALAAYLARDFADAAARFRELAREQPDNHAALIMARRARKLARRPPDDDWTGVYGHARK